MDLQATLKYLSAASLLTMTLATRAQADSSRSAPQAIDERFEDFLRRTVAAEISADKERIIETYWNKVKESGRPVMEDSTVYFIYLGNAYRVSVPSDLNGWNASADTMVRVEDTNFFYLAKTIERAARFEYKLVVDSTWIIDPVNRLQAMGGFGPNSVVRMPGYTPPQYIQYQKGTRHGRIEARTFHSKSLNRTHPCFVYLPAGYRQSRMRYPAIYVLDGGEYITLALMVNVLDNLISAERIHPVIAVFLDPRTDIRNSNTSKRMTEYALNGDFVTSLADELHPWIDATYRVDPRPEQTAILGASLGGLAATFAAYERPDVFGLCAAQSASYQWSDSALIDSIASGPRKPIKFYMSTGTIHDAELASRRMKSVLEQKGYELRYSEHPEGHNWVNWQARLSDLLLYFWGVEQ